MNAFILLVLFANLASARFFAREIRVALIAVLDGFSYTFQHDPEFQCNKAVVPVVGCVRLGASQVVSLTLHPQTSSGRIDSVPTQIGLLTDLVKLEINGLHHGTIPTQIANLAKLTELRMFDTLLAAPIPPELDMPRVDCLIEADAPTGERYKCTSCKPTRGCVVHPPDHCYDSCYLLEGNETVGDLRDTPRDADRNFNFDEEYGERLRLAKFGPTTTNTEATKSTSAAATTSFESTTLATGSTESVTVLPSPPVAGSDVGGESGLGQERDPDYTVVYIISAVLGFIVLMTLIGLGVYFAVMKRPSDDNFGNPLQRSNSAETRYTSVSQAVAPYGESSFAHLQ